MQVQFPIDSFNNAITMMGQFHRRPAPYVAARLLDQLGKIGTTWMVRRVSGTLPTSKVKRVKLKPGHTPHLRSQKAHPGSEVGSVVRVLGIVLDGVVLLVEGVTQLVHGRVRDADAWSIAHLERIHERIMEKMVASSFERWSRTARSQRTDARLVWDLAGGFGRRSQLTLSLSPASTETFHSTDLMHAL